MKYYDIVTNSGIIREKIPKESHRRSKDGGLQNVWKDTRKKEIRI
jgi:hypothetical protein